MAVLSAEEQAKIAKQIERQNKALAKQIAQEEELKKLQGERLRQIDKDIEASEKQVEHATDRLNLIAQASQMSDSAREARVEELKSEFESYKTKYKANELTKAEISEKAKLFGLSKSILESTNEELEAKRELAEIEKERAKTLEKQKKAAKEIGEAMKDMVSSSTGISDAWKTREGLAGSFVRSVEAGGSLTTTLGEIGNGIKNAINPTNFLASAFLGVVDSTKELFWEMDQVLGEFKKGTGLSKEYSDSLSDVRQNQVHLGYGMRDIAEQFDDITTANSAFVFQNEATRESLQNNVAAMGMAYDASTEFAEAVGFATTALGQAPDQAAKTTRGLATFAKAIKASPKEMMRDYAALAPRLAAWGDKATQVFKETAAAAKALNMETSAMLDIAGQFDTFDDAAEHVGQLNAMLGGDYFDTVEMVNATESERIEILMEGVRATGKSWDSLGRFERKAIATAAGITDMGEANKMFGQGLDVYKELKSHTDDASMSYNDLSDAAKENMSVQEKQNAIYKSLAISMEPFLDLANLGLGVIQSIASATGALFPWLVLAAGATLKWAVNKGLLTAIMNSNLVVSAWMYASIAAETVANWAGAAALWVKGAATTALTGSMGILAIATGAYNVVAAIGAAVTSVFAGAMAVLTAPITLVILGIMALIAVVGALIYYWDDLTSYVTSLTGGLFDMWDVLLLIMGPIGWLIGAARLVYNQWEPIKQMFLDIGDAIASVVSAIASAGSWVGSTLSSLNPFGDDDTEVAASAEGQTNFSGTSIVGEKGPEIITTKHANVISNENIVRLVETNERVTRSAGAAKTAEAEASIGILDSMASGFQKFIFGSSAPATASPSPSPPPPQEVILEIDGKKFAKLVIDPYLEGRLRPKLTV